MDSKSSPAWAPPSSLTPANGIPVTRRSGTQFTAERRGEPRTEVVLDVSVGSESHYFTAQSCDLSTGGLFLATYRALPKNGELSIEFDLPAGRVVAKAGVCWVRESQGGKSPGYGVSFVGLSRWSHALIDSFCRAQAGVVSQRCALAG